MNFSFFSRSGSEAVDLTVFLNEEQQASRSTVPLEVLENECAIASEQQRAVRVYVRERPVMREIVRGFISSSVPERSSVPFVAGRGKLIAELATLCGQEMHFGDLLDRTHSALARSSAKEFRQLDPEKLARQISVAAVELV